MTKRAVLYARVSDDDRRYVTSGIDNQLKECREYASRKGYQIVGEYHEEREKHTSGADWLPEIEKILELAEQGVFDVLVVRELDRLARDRVKHVLIKHHLEGYGVGIEYVIGQFADTDEGEFQEGVMREFAHYQRKQLTRKLHKGIHDHVRQGNIKTGGCASPYGYDLRDMNGRKVLVINEYEAEIVRLIFDLYVNKDYSIHAVCNYLDSHQIAKPMKGKAHKANENKARNLGWSRGTICGILANETYTGRWYYRKTKRVKNPKTGKTKHVPRPKSEWIQVKVPAIISDEMYQAARSLVGKNRWLKGKQHQNTYAIGGMVKCGRCGKSMTGVTRPIGGRNKRPYAYYICNARLHSKIYGYKCDNPYMPVGDVDGTIWGWVKPILLNPAKLLAELKTYQELQLSEIRPFLNMIDANKAKLAELEQQKARLIQAYTAGVLSLDEMAAMKVELDKQIADLSEALIDFQTDLEQRTLNQQDLEAIESLAAKIRKGGDLADDRPEAQRELFKALNMQVVLNELEGIPVADLHCFLGQIRLQANAGTGYSSEQRLVIRVRLPIGGNGTGDPLVSAFFAAVGREIAIGN